LCGFVKINRKELLICGLIGVAGDLEYKDEGLMKRLFVLDYFRGTDSTGLASIDGKGKPTIVKMATHPINLFDSKSFQSALSGYYSKAFIGHNRAATLGAVNDLNAHPFQFGDIIGAHNGTLEKSSWASLEFASGVKTDVDSAAIFACINEIGIEDTIKLMEEGKTSATGAWALVWYDMKDDTMNFLRNEHRPLWWALNDDGDKLIWASEWEMIEAASRLTPGYDTMVDDEGYGFYPFDCDWWYKVPIHELKKKVKIEEFAKFKVKKLKGKEPAELPVTTMGRAPFLRDVGKSGGTTNYRGTSTATQSPGASTTSSKTGSSSPKVHTLGASNQEPFGGAISVEEFDQLARYGCSFCGASIDIEDEGTTIYLDDDTILCASCSSNTSGDVKVYTSSTNSRTLVNVK
jgi:hypothetical protein